MEDTKKREFQGERDELLSSAAGNSAEMRKEHLQLSNVEVTGHCWPSSSRSGGGYQIGEIHEEPEGGLTGEREREGQAQEPEPAGREVQTSPGAPDRQTPRARTHRLLGSGSRDKCAETVPIWSGCWCFYCTL